MTMSGASALFTLLAILVAWLGWSGGDDIAAFIGIGEMTLVVRLGVVFIALSLLEAVLGRVIKSRQPH